MTNVLKLTTFIYITTADELRDPADKTYSDVSVLQFYKDSFLNFLTKSSQSSLSLSQYRVIQPMPFDPFSLTLCRTDGPVIKYPQFSDDLNALNVQPLKIMLLSPRMQKLQAGSLVVLH